MMNKTNFLTFASLVLCAALYLIWPTIHTIALRKLLIILSACIGIVLWARSDDRYEILKSPWFVFLGMLLLWVTFHAAVISENGMEAWREYTGQWVPAYVAVLAGIGLALAGRKIGDSKFRVFLFVVLAIQPVLFLIATTYKSIQLGYPAIRFELGILNTDLKTSLTFSSDMMAALACAKLLEASNGKPFDRTKYIWILPIALALFVAVFSQSFNSILLILSSVTLACVIFIYKSRVRLLRQGVAALIIVTMAFVYAASNVPAISRHWQNISSNVNVATDIGTYNNWTNFSKLGLPKNALNEELPVSFYLRVAYVTAALQAVYEYPWGYGVTRQAFERLVQKQYPDVQISNAHNGYLNLACSVGIPGLALYVLFLIAVFRQLKNSESELAKPAIWMIGIYVAHWGLDAIERDHFFESYLFVIALLLTMTLNKSTRQIHG